MIKASVAMLAFVVVFLLQKRKLGKYQKLLQINQWSTIDDRAVSYSAWKSLKQMFRIALPTLWGREGMGTMAFIGLFLLKALLRVRRSRAEGDVIQAYLLGTRGKGGTGRRDALLQFAAVSLLNAAVSGCIEHMRFYLIAVYRTRLTGYFHKRYFDKNTFYYGTVLDDRIADVDVHITSYCEDFAEHFAELPYYFFLPAFEAFSSLYVVFREVGSARSAMLTSIVFSGVIALQSLAPPFGKIHAALLSREEEFRRLHTDVKNNVEQVALHKGGDFMRRRLEAMFGNVGDAMQYMALARGHFQMLELSLTSCAWDIAGFFSVGSLLLSTKDNTNKTAALSQVVVQRRVITDFNTAVNTLVQNMKELSHLSEFSEKLAELDSVLDSIARLEFQKKPDPRFLQEGDDEHTVSGSTTGMAASRDNLAALSNSFTLETRERDVAEGNHSDHSQSAMTLVEFDDLDVATPNGVVLVAGLTHKIRLGESWALTGPNGCGKSSILRVLSSIWLPSRGRMTIHPIVDLYFLPQQTFMVPNCTLVEQIIFPDTTEGVEPSLDEETRVKNALYLATGDSIVEEVFGEWENPLCTTARTQDWYSLSGGQQQKIALARLFYHARRSHDKGRVVIAVMDESTSQMDIEAERILFQNLARKDIQMVSSSHRKEVTRIHHKVLKMTRDPSEWKIQSQTPVLMEENGCTSPPLHLT